MARDVFPVKTQPLTGVSAIDLPAILAARQRESTNTPVQARRGEPTMDNPYEAPRNPQPRRPANQAPKSNVLTSQDKIAWYDQIWLGLALVLVAVGGGIGGACGGAAWAINQKIFRATKPPVLRYVLTGLVSAAAVLLYFVLARVVLSLMNANR